MQVATVAWAAERKNIISMMFYLLALMAYVSVRRFTWQAEKENREGAWVGAGWRYLLMLVLFQAGLFSKTATLTLPITLFFTDRLLERRWDFGSMLGSALRIAPMIVMAAIAANTTMTVEDRNRTIPLTEAQRPLLPAASLLFYVWKMLVPINQSPVYRLWNPQPDLVWIMPILIVGVLAALMFIYRKKLGPHFLWAILMYVVMQFPMLGFKNINYFQFSFVADHYFYHGSLGLFAAVAIGLEALGRRLRDAQGRMVFATALTAVIAVALGARTFTYSDVWKNSEAFWKRTLALNDRCWAAWYNTANARRNWAGERLAKATKLEDEITALEKNAARKEAEAAALAGTDASNPESEALLADAQKLRADAAPLRTQAGALRAEREALLDDAVERYLKVADIHKGISQPFEQWIAVRKEQGKWADAAAGAEAAIRRFPHLLRFYEQAADFALQAKQPERAAVVATQCVAAARKDQNITAACYILLGTAQAMRDKVSEGAQNILQGAPVVLARGDAYMKRNSPCAARFQYERILQAFERAPALVQEPTLAVLYNAIKSKRKQARDQCTAMRHVESAEE
jgi:hypothetical protein